MSGSLQGAGGVGGLLMAEEISGATATPHYYCYDGNGNVTHVLDASGNIEAMHRYTAFGGDLENVTTTAFAQRNPWRFSTKYLDREVETTEGLYYYGYRFYLTALGRWPSRDPIGERGGINLYGMVGNDAVDWIDFLGRDRMSNINNKPHPGAPVPPSNQRPPAGPGIMPPVPNPNPGPGPISPGTPANAGDAAADWVELLGSEASKASYASAVAAGKADCIAEKVSPTDKCNKCCYFSVYPNLPDASSTILVYWRYSGANMSKKKCSEIKGAPSITNPQSRPFYVDL